jgi:carbohydrate-binding DOMON domain-containing protein
VVSVVPTVILILSVVETTPTESSNVTNGTTKATTTESSNITLGTTETTTTESSNITLGFISSVVADSVVPLLISVVPTVTLLLSVGMVSVESSIAQLEHI